MATRAPDVPTTEHPLPGESGGNGHEKRQRKEVKTPWYKRPWVWALGSLAAVGVVGGGVAVSGGKGSSEKAPAASSAPNRDQQPTGVEGGEGQVGNLDTKTFNQLVKKWLKQANQGSTGTGNRKYGVNFPPGYYEEYPLTTETAENIQADWVERFAQMRGGYMEQMDFRDKHIEVVSGFYAIFQGKDGYTVVDQAILYGFGEGFYDNIVADNTADSYNEFAIAFPVGDEWVTTLITNNGVGFSTRHDFRLAGFATAPGGIQVDTGVFDEDSSFTKDSFTLLIDNGRDPVRKLPFGPSQGYDSLASAGQAVFSESPDASPQDLWTIVDAFQGMPTVGQYEDPYNN